MAGPVAAAIDHVQRLAGVGQREDQRVIPPLALVVDVHPLLALAGGLDHRAVGVEDRLLEERLRLPTPDPKPRGVEDFLQAEDVGRLEAAAEVARRGGIGDAAGPQGVEVGLVAAQQFQVLQARSAGQQVVGDVQHVVRLVVGEVDLQQLDVLVDQLVEPQFPYQEVHGPDSAVGGREDAISDLVVDVRGGHHGPTTPAIVVPVQPPRDPPLASFDPFSYRGVHSKTSVLRNWESCRHSQYVRKRRRFSSFSCQIPGEPFGVRLA